MKWYLKAINQYFDFKGRASRKEFWLFMLFHLIFLFTAMVLDILLGLTSGEAPFGTLYFIYALVTFIPYLAVNVRRLHDIGKSGSRFLFFLIPLIGIILYFVWFCTDSQPGENEWGVNPKEKILSS